MDHSKAPEASSPTAPTAVTESPTSLQLEAEKPNSSSRNDVAERFDWASDPSNPVNFSMTRKWAICIMKSWLTLCVSFASSVYSAAIFVTAETFYVSDVVMILGVSLYVLGYAFGIAVDILNPATRRLSTILFLGNVLSSGLSLRNRILVGDGRHIVTGPSLVLAYFVIPETYQPVLQKRNVRKRLNSKEAADKELANPQHQRLTFRDFMSKYMKTPMHMLVVEPILAILTVYLSLVYGILYLTLEAFPISFQVERRWSAGVASLPFLGLLAGFVIACLLLVYSPPIMQLLRIQKRGPEDQLIPMMLGAILLPVGLFWFSGTSSPHLNAAPQIISTVPIGIGILLIFAPGLGYIIETYLLLANAALSANSFLRSLFGFAFPLFAPAMYRNLGTPWATRLLGFLTVALMPFPFLFRLRHEGAREQPGDAPRRKP
ncbi:hypothetical protein PRZ48_011279 [Zasmidium cellare]|uniref:Uncharacterized protein n=1 Tax=Zasmidium cellare TaxID=395010 RepID=A0ABR0EAX4_ZASCE|nr:hypothetical protein PRZ48_011279 [Zasmidium cellare]